MVMEILNKSMNSLVIVTTRDVRVLITAGITVHYNLQGMDRNYARELFCWHAFGQPYPSGGYENLVDAFVEVCGGLPLSLQVLGVNVRGGAHSYWGLELIKARQMLPGDVKQILRISFDALDGEQKQVFMDMACFFVGKFKRTAERVWEGSGWNAQHALETLKAKSLVEEIKSYGTPISQWEYLLRMHDHLRNLGREMALELRPPHRLWRPQDLKSLESRGFKNILSLFDKYNFRCFHSFFDKSMDFQVTFFIGQSDNCVETSASLLWLKLEGNSTEQSSIPSWIPLQNLHYLEINSGQLKTLWEKNMQVPSSLKELLIFQTSLKEFPDLSGISDSLENAFLESLEKLVISGEKFVSMILISGIHYPSLEFVTLEGMENLMEVNLRTVKTLKSLTIVDCKKLKRLTGTSDLTNTVLLRIIRCPDLEELRLAPRSSLERIRIDDCKHLKIVLGIPNLAKLVELDIYGCEKLEFDHLCLSGMKCLQRMTFDRHVKVKYFELDGFQNLKTIQFGCKELVELSIRGCPELEDLPAFEGPSCLERIAIDGCGKLKCLQVDDCQNLKSVSGNFDLGELHITDCPELEEVPRLDRLSCLKSIRIHSCEKLQNNISGIKEWHVSDYASFCYCNNAVIRSCIHKLKSVPSRSSFIPVALIGRAVDGAESTLNRYPFSEFGAFAGIENDVKWPILYAPIENVTHETDVGWPILDVLIVNFLVVVDSFSLVEDINNLVDNDFKVRQGEWIITMVVNYLFYSEYQRIEYVYRKYGILKGVFCSGLKEDENLKTVRVLRATVDMLYH